jgi:topoisomerase-4 subunit A
MIRIVKHDPARIITAVYVDGASGHFYVKRFQAELTEKPAGFLNDHKDSRLVELSLDWLPVIRLQFQEKNGRVREPEEINVAEFIGVKSFRAKGRRLSEHPVGSVEWLEPLPYSPPQIESDDEDPGFPESVDDLPEPADDWQQPDTGPEVEPSFNDPDVDMPDDEEGQRPAEPRDPGKQITLEFD